MSIDTSKLIDGLNSAGMPKKGYEVTQEGDVGTIETPYLAEADVDFDQILRKCGFSPDVYEIAGDPKVKRWEAQTPDGIEWLSSYGISVRKRADQSADVDELVQIIRCEDTAALPPRADLDGLPTVFAVGDTQLGKPDGDGTEGTVRRFKASVEKAVALYDKAPTQSVLIAFLGDLIEGFVSQGGKVAGYSELTLTEQLRLMRHLAAHAISEFRAVCADVHVAVAPGNHAEGFRAPFSTKPSDNFDTDVIRAVEEAYNLAGVDGLTFHYPQGEELAVAVELGDVKILCHHGHSWRPGKHFQWWEGQAFGKRTGWDAQYLLSGHLHHLHIEASSDRLFIQVPAMESRSDWWVNKTGQTGNPGAIYMIPAPSGHPVTLTVV